MGWRDRGIIVLLTVVGIGGLVLIPAAGRPYPLPTAWDGQPRFHADRAWSDLATLATRFPRRWSGSPDRRAAADWLAGELRRAGLDVHRESFPIALGEPAPVVMENVWGVSRGTELPEELVVPLGNYDMAPTSYQAASDTAGHVGTLLELARAIHSTPHRRTFVFLFPDGEEWGMLGARHFATTFPQRAQIVAALSIEDLDPGNLTALGIDGVGQFRGFSPMWLRAVAAQAAIRDGFPVDEVPPLFEWLQRSILVSFTDQGPFLTQGIPAIDLPGRGDDDVLKDRIYHMPDDVVEHMRPAAVAAYGRINERILRTIDSLPAGPHEPEYYLRLGPDRIVTGARLLFVQLAVFLPLLAAIALRERTAGPPLRALRVEAAGTAAILGPLLVWLAAVKMMPALGLLPAYTLYPPPPRHPLLTTVSWIPILLSFAVLIAALWATHRWARVSGGDGPMPSRAGRIWALLVFLAAVALVAVTDNPFGAVTFMLLPALLWVWIEPGRSTLGRLVAAALVGTGFLVIVALLAQYGALLQLGPYILWYIFMSLAYGQFTALRLVLALAMVAIGIRLLIWGSGSREQGAA